MITVLESLRSLSSYFIPDAVIANITDERGISMADMTTPEMRTSAPYRLAKADIFMWLSTAPNISQQGDSYDTLVTDREMMRKQANIIYQEYQDARYIPEAKPKATYGYKGDRL